MRIQVPIKCIAFLIAVIFIPLHISTQQPDPSQWDDPPKYGEMVLSIKVQEISSMNLVLLHSMTIKKVKSIIGERTLQIKDINGKAMSISFTEYFKEVTFTSPDGTRGGFFRIELPKLKQKHQDEIVKECSALLKELMAKEGIISEWSIKIVTKEPALPK